MKITLFLLFCLAAITGCEDTNLRLASQAGLEAVQALTLSEDEVKELSARTAEHLDAKHEVAPEANAYAQRLQKLVARHRKMNVYTFAYDPDMAVSAVEKLATLGSDHSFLSTHPASQERAKRLHTQLTTPNQGHKEEKKSLVQTFVDFGRHALFWALDLLVKILDSVLHLFGKGA